jgi:hypothetical protein
MSMFRWVDKDELDARAARMRNAHQQWLTWALRRGKGLPRIPTRLESQGGYGPIMATAEGREWAAEYWSVTLSDECLGGNHAEGRSAG